MFRTVLFCVFIGLLYYAGAYIGVHYAALPDGIVVLWPPNAALLAAFLLLRWQQWPLAAVCVLIAEIAADVPVFTVLEATLFGLINITECTIAATLITALNRLRSQSHSWQSPQSILIFLITVGAIASPLAAIGGATVYTVLIGAETPFLSLWRLWWVGDSTGLIVLTPFLHMFMTFIREQRYTHRPSGRNTLEVTAAFVVTMGACALVFTSDMNTESFLATTPFLVLAGPLWIAARRPALPAAFLSATVALYAAFSTAHGLGPFSGSTPTYNALMAQEFTVLFTLAVLFTNSMMAQKRRHEASLRIHRSAIEAAADGILIFDARDDHPIRYCNPSFSRITGYEKGEVLGETGRFLITEETDRAVIAQIENALRHSRPFQSDLLSRKKDGSQYCAQLSIDPVHNDEGRLTHFVGVIRDITVSVRQNRQLEEALEQVRLSNAHLEELVSQRTKELERANKRLKTMAMTDELTDIPNRRKLLEHGNKEMARCQRQGEHFAALVLDIDHFKTINDDYGHEIGDQALRWFVSVVQSELRAMDFMGRWGGEEFLILTSGNDEQDLETMADRLLRAVSETPFTWDGQSIRITTSIGGALYSDHEALETLIQRADDALYRAKDGGRNRFECAQRDEQPGPQLV
ncbi:PAS domain S-box-containing protein/diguanylate cyclase (GGDEF)-like protein [Tamilnaduibacter salinus]|uniref:PAS domain S-box-containing protein/diguanylate cyclase (GGDEF)-like protein n=1 Tax=Tamilnaduibacter salinus TaxID=1484056 RepID=A0A2U1CTL7_9GAMM|nr:diguanylate cyclase [Tamilnaduibacter salinus]PVY70089.1 PAS domain S-box-containing protein/diguanylate cyclase (GGDEF)-like protein [Tamilnaduibacter salinus]